MEDARVQSAERKDGWKWRRLTTARCRVSAKAVSQAAVKLESRKQRKSSAQRVKSAKWKWETLTDDPKIKRIVFPDHGGTDAEKEGTGKSKLLLHIAAVTGEEKENNKKTNFVFDFHASPPVG